MQDDRIDLDKNLTIAGTLPSDALQEFLDEGMHVIKNGMTLQAPSQIKS